MGTARRPHRWLRRLRHPAVGVALFLVATAVLLWVALWAGTNRQLRLAREEARSDGVPLGVDDLGRAGIAPFNRPLDGPIAAAADAFDWTAAASGELSGRVFADRELTPEERVIYAALAAEAAGEQRAVLDRVVALAPSLGDASARVSVHDWEDLRARQARGEPAALEALGYSDAAGASIDLTAALLWDAKAAADAGDGRRAFDRCVVLFDLADALDRGGMLQGHAVARARRTMAAEALLDLAVLAPTAYAQVPAAERRTMIARLLRTSTSRTWPDALRRAAAIVDDRFDAVADGREELWINCCTKIPLTNSVGLPLVRGDHARALRWIITFARAADAPTLRAFRTRTSTRDVAFDGTGWRHMVAWQLTHDYASEEVDEYVARAQLRAVATVLAAADFRLRHGSLPPSLDVLVPEFLDGVPRDPLAEDAPLRYDAARGTVWSVGVDAADGGGDRASVQPHRRGWVGEADRLDIVLPLTPLANEAMRPTTRPSRPLLEWPGEE